MMRNVILAVAAAFTTLAAPSAGATGPTEIIYKTSRVAPSAFKAWTFFWTMPEIEEGATLQYVVLQPDGKEYYRLSIHDAKPGQHIRSDFSKDFAGGDPEVFHGKHILFKFIVDKGPIRFPEDADLRFEFQTTIPAVPSGQGAIAPADRNAPREYKGPKETARAFWTACAEGRWDIAARLAPHTTAQNLKDLYAGVRLINLGEPFKSAKYAGWYVPYEIQLPSGETKNFNLAIRNDNPAKRFVVDGGM